MRNEEIIISHDPGRTIFLSLKRRWHFVECLSRVLVSINGVEVASISNGKEVLLPVEPHATIFLDLQSPAWHNYYKVELSGKPEIEFSFSWSGSGGIFRHNNIRLLSHSGCLVTETDREATKLQKTDNWFSGTWIGIMTLLYIAIKIYQCACCAR